MNPTDGTLKVQSDIILVEPLDEVLEESRLILVPGADDHTRLGIVKYTGPGKRCKKTGLRMPMQIMVGMRVLYGSYTGEDLQMNLGGIDLTAIREPDVMAIVH
ncbi:MAG: hypothetical protein BMS9Abin36_2093 [Gammaproteobacteria bacterium]|nr:MAG: hypothetical protein BMS9Abin36_2093 [Gammaproteobacteria bacterium]